MRRAFWRIVLLVLTACSIQAPAWADEAPRAGAIAHHAARLVGAPYVPGGNTPHGFDCSGLVQYVYGHARVALPHRADRQYALGAPVALAEARPGDLLFFALGPVPNLASHVGIYLGNGRMVHAPGLGKPVRIAQVGSGSWFAPRLLGVRRLFGAPARRAFPPAHLARMLAREPSHGPIAAEPIGRTGVVRLADAEARAWRLASAGMAGRPFRPGEPHAL